MSIHSERSLPCTSAVFLPRSGPWAPSSSARYFNKYLQRLQRWHVSYGNFLVVYCWSCSLMRLWWPLSEFSELPPVRLTFPSAPSLILLACSTILKSWLLNRQKKWRCWRRLFPVTLPLPSVTLSLLLPLLLMTSYSVLCRQSLLRWAALQNC
jgi:hypothetical protein